MTNLSASYLTIGIIVIITIVVFLILREFFCWYWKINKRVKLLECIDRKLSKEETHNSEIKNKFGYTSGGAKNES